MEINTIRDHWSLLLNLRMYITNVFQPHKYTHIYNPKIQNCCSSHARTIVTGAQTMKKIVLIKVRS